MIQILDRINEDGFNDDKNINQILLDTGGKIIDELKNENLKDNSLVNFEFRRKIENVSIFLENF